MDATECMEKRMDVLRDAMDALVPLIVENAIAKNKLKSGARNLLPKYHVLNSNERELLHMICNTHDETFRTLADDLNDTNLSWNIAKGLY